MTTIHCNPEPPIEFDVGFNFDDVSSWVELGDVTVRPCCLNGWLPCIDGTMVECPYHPQPLR